MKHFSIAKKPNNLAIFVFIVKQIITITNQMDYAMIIQMKIMIFIDVKLLILMQAFAIIVKKVII